MNVKSNKKRKTCIIRLAMKASVIQNGVRISTPIKNNPRVIVRRNGVLNNSQKEWVVEKYIEHIKSVTSIKEVEFIFYTYEELNQKRSDFFMDFWSHGLSVFPTLELDVDNGEYNYKDYITFFCGGLLEAIGTVVPGVSSTALLLLMGIYQIIISLFANITNLEIVKNSFNIILPFLFGLILGIYIVSLLISKLFCHYKNTTYNIILGIFISTIISLTYQTLTKLSTTHELIIGIPLLLVGYTLGKAFDR